ncbi:MAG: hypothetical protein IJL47_04555 [Lachnospiraceae bacterium]|nr:hypothetical protein [Lachnospiraceae bacterium]MBQ6197203.1 hypothetical protein [Lachnospiraceae bacterium]
MKTTKLVLGILGLILSIVIMMQSCAASVVNVVEDNGDVGGFAGYLVAFLLIAGSIVMIATRNSQGKGGAIAALIIFLIAGGLAVSNAAVYKDLAVWGIACFILAVVNLLSALLKKKPSD